MGHDHKKRRPSRSFRLNSFRLNGLEHLEVGYRLINVSGLVEDDDGYEKKIRQLANVISGRVKMPVEPIRIDRETKLAVAGLSAKLEELAIDAKYGLTPDDAFTSFDGGIRPLKLRESEDRGQTKLARRALDWAIDKALKPGNSGWWKYDRRFVRREASGADRSGNILVMPAFYFGFVPGHDGIFELSLDPSVCYIERLSLGAKYDDKIPLSVKGRRFLYRNGLEYYPITAVGIGKSAGKEMMEDPDTGEIISIYQRLIRRWGNSRLDMIDSLEESGLTIAYKTLSEKGRKAHSQLLFELVGVGGSDDGHEPPHDEAIMNPRKRGSLTEQVVEELRSSLKMFGARLEPNRRMRSLDREAQVFDPPKLQFGDGTVLTTNLKTMARDRFDALKHIGPYERSDFDDEQLFVFGDSLPEEVRNDFKAKFIVAMEELYGRSPRFQNVRVDDRRARVFREKFNAVVNAVGERRGYALMVLPSERKAGQSKKLHDALKRKLWDRVQTQCAAAEMILSFYKGSTDRFGERRWELDKRKADRYRSYLRFLALGYLEVNRKWLWKLADGTLRNEVHVGIDVYQDLAVFTFIYKDANLMTFYPVASRRGERLTADLVREALVNNLTPELKQLGLVPTSIVFHRDGKFFRTEAKGILAALEELKSDGVLAEDLR